MTLPVTQFVFYLMLATAALMLLAALISRALHARSERRALAARVICRLCLAAFEDRSHLKTVDCPSCGATNEKGRSPWAD
jgi:protein-arginine kinase activator protein McsA